MKKILEGYIVSNEQNAQDLIVKAPSEVDSSQLKELSIKKDIKKD